MEPVPDSPRSEVRHIAADEGIALWVPEEPPPDLVDGEGPEMSTYRFVATADSTAGALAVVDTLVPAGNGPPEHTHLAAAASSSTGRPAWGRAGWSLRSPLGRTRPGSGW